VAMYNPPYPGEFIRAAYLEPFDSPEMALQLSKALGRSPESWPAMQDNHDLWQTRKTTDLSHVQRVKFEAA